MFAGIGLVILLGMVFGGFAITGEQSRSGQARSMHAGGVNCCFVDGSVHFIKNKISFRKKAESYFMDLADGPTSERRSGCSTGSRPLVFEPW